MGPVDARGPDSWIQVLCGLVGPRSCGKGSGLSHLGREGLRELDFKPVPMLGARGAWITDDKGYGAWTRLGEPGDQPPGRKTALSALDKSGLGVQSPSPAPSRIPQDPPGLTSAAPGLPPLRLPTASCARRSSGSSVSNSCSGGGPRRQPRSRAAGRTGPMSRPSRPHVPCTPARPQR